MTISARIAWIGLMAGTNLSWWGAIAGQGGAQARPGQPGPRAQRAVVEAWETIDSINHDYNRQLLQLERQRLERLGRLAARQAPRDAAETYETLFRLAIANNLFREAEPAAEQVLRSTRSPSPVVLFLAQTIDILAAADRGAFDESLASLRRVMGAASRPDRPAEAPAALLDTPSLLAICAAYYQRLLQGDRFDIARKAFQLVHDETRNPAVKEFCAARLNQLNLVGKPAPPIQGRDIDGKAVSLSDFQGQVILVVFWASWCLPNAAEIAWLDQVYQNYHNRGFRILGINLDPLQNGGTKLETVMPNLVNGTGAQDYAKAYGVTDIPANVLIGRDGRILHLDLSRKNLVPVIDRTVSQR
jgi:thiol-disulfide isomerase/thioredoxin